MYTCLSDGRRDRCSKELKNVEHQRKNSMFNGGSVNIFFFVKLVSLVEDRNKTIRFDWIIEIRLSPGSSSHELFKSEHQTIVKEEL